MRDFTIAIILFSICLSRPVEGEEDVFARREMASKKEAIFLSVLFPGLGQLSSGHKLKGTIILVSEIGSLVIALTANESYKTRLDDFDRLKAEYERMKAGNSSYDLAQQKWSELSQTGEDLDGLHLVRRTFGTAAAGIYLYSLVDILLSHPQKSAAAVKWKAMAIPGWREAPPRVVVRRSF